MLELTLPEPFEWQRQVLASGARYRVVAVGRRAGKTQLGVLVTVESLLRGHRVGWFAPTYKLLTEAWRELRSILSPVIAQQNLAEHRLELISGGVLEVWTGVDPDAGRSRRYHRVILDEAAFFPDLLGLYQASIRPTLADTGGDALFLSTPNGRNGFWELWRRGQAGEAGWQSWQLPSTVNPRLPAAEIEEIRRSVLEIVYRQEILAEFLESSGAVFSGVRDSATAQPHPQAQPGSSYTIGIDFGRSRDFTAICVIAWSPQPQVCWLERFTDLDFSSQLQRIEAICRRYAPQIVLAEQNNFGWPLIEELRRRGLPVQGFLTTSATKRELVDRLSLALSQRQIRLLPDPVLLAELESFTSQRLPSGLLRYGAEAGAHDDSVIALLLAYWAGHEACTIAPPPDLDPVYCGETDSVSLQGRALRVHSDLAAIAGDPLGVVVIVRGLLLESGQIVVAQIRSTTGQQLAADLLAAHSQRECDLIALPESLWPVVAPLAGDLPLQVVAGGSPDLAYRCATAISEGRLLGLAGVRPHLIAASSPAATSPQVEAIRLIVEAGLC